MNAIRNITIGHTERLYKPVGFTMLANLVNIVPFCLSIEAIRIIFSAFDGSGQPLDTTRLWWIFGIMAVYHDPPVVDIRHYGCLYAGHGFGRTGILPSQF